MGFAERRAEGTRTPEHPTRRVLIPSSQDLACLIEPLAIHLDPTEPSGDMDTRAVLRQWLEFMPDPKPTAWLFPSENGKTPLLNDNCWQQSIVPRLKEVGLQRANFQVTSARASAQNAG